MILSVKSWATQFQSNSGSSVTFTPCSLLITFLDHKNNNNIKNIIYDKQEKLNLIFKFSTWKQDYNR